MRFHHFCGKRIYTPFSVCVISLFMACAGPDSGSAKIFTVAASNASNPTIAMDKSAERIYVVWVGTANDRSNVYLASMKKGEGQFSAPAQVNDIPGDAAASAEAPAQVAVGPERNVYVLWHNSIPIEGRRFPASNLRFSRSTDGGKTFAPAILVNDDFAGPATGHNFHSLAVAPEGAIYVAWLDNRDPASSPEVRVARSIDGGQSFEPGVVVAQKVCECCRTALATDAQGIVYLVYRGNTADNVRDIAIARSEDRGRTFSSPTVIHDDGWVIEGCPHNGPAIDVDAEGNLHVAWYTGREDRFGLYYAVSRNRGESFDSPIPLNAVLNASALRAAVAAPNRDRVFLACEAVEAQGSHIYFWGPASVASNHTSKERLAAGTYPAMAMTDDFIAVAWLEGQFIRATFKAL